MLAVSALAISACGSESARPAPSSPRPATPVNLAVYIDNGRVSIAPARVGAGPVTFIITNQAGQTESLVIRHTGASAVQPLADTGPINPQATAQVSVDLSSPGEYSVATAGPGSGSDSSIKAAVLHVGPPRPSSDNQLLQP